MPRVPFVGSLTTRGGQKSVDFTTYDQLFQNVMFEVVRNPVTGSGIVYVDRRMGFAGTSTQSSFTNIHRAFRWRNLGVDQIVYAGIESGGTNARIIGSGTIYTHASADEILWISETTDSAGTASLVWQRSNGEAWIYPNAGVVAQISAIPSGNAGPIVHMDGFSFVAIAATALIRNSQLNDPTTWPTTGSIKAQENEDRLVRLAKYKNYVVAFGQESTEFFVNAGNPSGSPLQRVQSMAKPFGLYSIHMLAYGMESMFILTQGKNMPLAVVSLSTSGVDRLSTPIVESILSNVQQGLAGLSFFKIGGNNYLLVGWTNSGPHGLVYHFETKLWFYWKSGVTTMRWGRDIDQGSDYSIRAFDASSNNVYDMNTYSTNVKYQDGPIASPTAIERIIRTMPMDEGTNNRKMEISMALIGDRAASTHNIAYSYSDDDYQNFSTAVNIDMSLEQNKVTRLGSYRRRSRRFVDSNTTRSRLEAFEYEVQKGSA